MTPLIAGGMVEGVTNRHADHPLLEPDHLRRRLCLMARVSAADITRAIEALALGGAVVCIHASLRSLGQPLSDGADTIIDAFLAQGCTILSPTFSDDFAIWPPAALQLPRNGWDYQRARIAYPGEQRIFHTSSNDLTIADMGQLAAAILARPHRQRGNHPLCSFTAIGPRSHELVSSQRPEDLCAPFRVLADLDGLVLLAGVDLTSMTLLHYCEAAAGRTLFRRWANGDSGTPILVECGGCSNGFAAFEPVLKEVSREHQVAASRWRVFPASDVVTLAGEAIRTTPAMTSCGNPQCSRCRDAFLGGPILHSP